MTKVQVLVFGFIILYHKKEDISCFSSQGGSAYSGNAENALFSFTKNTLNLKSVLQFREYLVVLIKLSVQILFISLKDV